jgi:hypothetical protein
LMGVALYTSTLTTTHAWQWPHCHPCPTEGDPAHLAAGIRIVRRRRQRVTPDALNILATGGDTCDNALSWRLVAFVISLADPGANLLHHLSPR